LWYWIFCYWWFHFSSKTQKMLGRLEQVVDSKIEKFVRSRSSSSRWHFALFHYWKLMSKATAEHGLSQEMISLTEWLAGWWFIYKDKERS
jgi:hypothetical protein